MTRRAHSPAASTSKAETIAKTLAMGRSHHNLGHLKLAQNCYQQVLSLDSDNVDALHLMGVLAFQSDALDEAIRLMKRAARKNPREPAIFVNLGAAYRKAERNAEARDAYDAAIKLKPDLWEAYFNLGKVFTDLEEFDNAIETYRKCLAISPNNAEAYVSLGNAYKYKGEGDNALLAYERALRLDGKLTQAYGNSAAVFLDRGWHSAALAIMDRAVADKPEPGELRFKRSLMALRFGRLETGWSDYESRFVADKERIPRCPSPPVYWTGGDLADKTILLWTEQGLGDEILYSSMVPEIIKRAKHCIIECSPRMAPIFARSFPEATVTRYRSQGVAVTPAAGVNYQIGVASLGQFYRTDFKQFPRHQGYMKADPARTAALRARYQAANPGNLVVGVSWRSKNDSVGGSKTADLASWAHILGVKGITFVNLQYGDCEEDLLAVKQTLGIEVLQDNEIDPLRNMDDFFAQVAAMDLVISTSNTTVHVASSMNIPTWVMLATGPASLWYWFLDRTDSPWYPSLKLFRQPSFDEHPGGAWWSDVEARIGKKLSAWAEAQSSRR
jgi:Flp pilus assembly protein TadD